jgi:hypothetical protein
VLQWVSIKETQAKSATWSHNLMFETLTREDVYNLIRRGVWNRGPNSGTESGHTWLYRPFGALARRCHNDRATLESMRDEFLRLYGVTDAPPSVMPDLDTTPEGCVAIVDALFDSMPHGHTLVSEGYAMNSKLEGSDLDYHLVRETHRRGKRTIYAGGTVCDQWNDKSFFREQALQIHGPQAVTHGTHFEEPTTVKVSGWLESVLVNGADKAVVKVIGAAGHGNLIVKRGAISRHEIGEFLSHAKGSWVIGEVWRPWVKSCCVSFFAPDDTCLPVHMTTCGQVLTKTGGFIGGKSFDTLTDRDQVALGAICRPLAIRMRDYGIRAFMGFDVILCIPQKGDRNILPDSGLAVVFIETNARLNGHNQEILALDLLARRDGIDRESLVHMRVRNKPVAGASDRAASQRFFANKLKGIAEPLTPHRMTDGVAYFLLDVNCGEAESAHDAVMFVGSRSAEAAIGAAYERLLGEELLLS